MELMSSLLSIGFPPSTIAVMNLVFQMMFSKLSICCRQHAIRLINDWGVLRSLNLGFNHIKFFPLGPPMVPHPGIHTLPSYDSVVIKRFIFGVDRITRQVICVLPPSFIPKENDKIDKITVVVMLSPKRGLGPGLIVYPHSVLSRDLCRSLDSSDSISENWVIGAHQRGGLTQSMLLEYLEGGVKWLKTVKREGVQNHLFLDWWWCLDANSLNKHYQDFYRHELSRNYDIHKDPIELAIGSAMERDWGMLVRSFSRSSGQNLMEKNFGCFIVDVLRDLSSPPRLTQWCSGTGICPIDHTRATRFKIAVQSYEFF